MNQDILKYEIELDEYHYLQKAKRKETKFEIAIEFDIVLLDDKSLPYTRTFRM